MRNIPTVKRKIQRLVTQAGIYHNPSLGLISLSSDGENWMTIADKNLGATQVWNDGDELTEANCGGFFQWGNNQPMSWDGAVGFTTTQVDATGYGPGNYYSAEPIGNQTEWMNPVNDNLWGEGTDTVEARQGPCGTGFHVCGRLEMNNLRTILVSLGVWDDSNGTDISKYLKMPFAGKRNYSNLSPMFQGTQGLYWTADHKTATLLSTGSASWANVQYTTNGFSIRPFKNEPVVPTSERIVLYQLN